MESEENECWYSYDSDNDEEYIPDLNENYNKNKPEKLLIKSNIIVEAGNSVSNEEGVQSKENKEKENNDQVLKKSKQNKADDDKDLEAEKTGNHEESRKSRNTRSRQRNSSQWACVLRKQKYDRGQEYVSVRKKLVPARKITSKKDCENKCIYKCSKNISERQREAIFTEYYTLSSKEKRMFLLSTTEMCNPDRRRKGKNGMNSRRKVSYRYYFNLNSQKIPVCKVFYHSTLSISQKPIYTVHSKKTVANIPFTSAQGKHRKKYTSEEAANLVREHINSFHRVSSHYCRQNSSREYLESDLSIRKMYELYKEFVTGKEKLPIKFCVYRNIFCKEYNLYFHTPRKDRCDFCEEVKIKEKDGIISQDKVTEFEAHLREKEKMRKERKKDKEDNKAVLCFDLENVLTCPKAEVKNFFYKSKLNVYNMTAHLSLGKKVYCSVWPETLHGRSGNDIASAVYKILDRVLTDHPYIDELILWSDSCVPQNRNSLMSFAVSSIIRKHVNLKKVTMKFSVPGHSCIQDVDAIHSCIERTLKKTEYYSPVSLLRILHRVNMKNPYRIFQMQPDDFFDFQAGSRILNYTVVPFSRVSVLEFTENFSQVRFKTSFNQNEFFEVNIRNASRTRAMVHLDELFNLKKAEAKVQLPQNKIEALSSMLKWMPQIDQEYYKNILELEAEPKRKAKRGNQTETETKRMKKTNQ